MQVLDNITNTVRDDLKNTIRKGSKVGIAAATFSIYAFEELKQQLEDVDELRFIFTSPTFTMEKEKKEKREFYISRLMRERSLYGTEFEIRLRNELTQKAIARECAEWIRAKASFRSNVSGEQMMGFMSVDDSSYMPLNGFTAVDLGCERGNNAYYPVQKTESYENGRYFLNLFESVWRDSKKLEDVTQEVIESISAAYNENSPDFIYFVTLYNIFNEFLEDISEDVLPNEATGFKQSRIWNMLFNFQKDAALAIINKLEKFNGCILADSVGLGKTFTALAVIKYYENRNKSVLVLCPKKLTNNWNTYKDNYVNNPIAADRLRYDVLYHTDLNRTRGSSNGLDLSRLNWGNYDLVVIDESHNFRNGGKLTGGDNEKENRYMRLMNKVVRAGVKTKVLMLSATPVNNRFVDLRNQLALAYEGHTDIVDEKLNTTRTIDEIFRNAQKAFNVWSRWEPAERTTANLLRMLDFDFFEVLDSVTIARSRKHIQKYYDTADIGSFPKRRKPISMQPRLTDLKTAINYNEIFEQLMLLTLSIYTPSHYIQPSKMEKYAELYEDNKVNVGFTQANREQGIRRLTAINLMKRMESSVYSFDLTLRRIRELIDSTIGKIDAYDRHSSVKLDLTEIDAADQLDEDDQNSDELFTFGRKVKIDLADMDYVSWRRSLQKDSETLALLSFMIADISPEHDSKLQALFGLLKNKVERPINEGNKKVIIFTAFADTADYLYLHVGKYMKNTFGLDTAMITGTVDGRTTAKLRHTDMNTILTCFSPVSKDKHLLMPDDTTQIDILIATDCISEGQNLQDCDYLINYDIHWNPVRIIQRFGRIDRIGSRNSEIQLVNFWPDVSLDEYIDLKSKVETRMKIVDMTATGDDNIISDEEKTELEYRKQQLKRLKEEVVDIEEMSSGISIMDLGLNEFRLDLLEYIRSAQDLDKTPFGLHAVTQAREDAPEGVVFVLKNRSDSVNIDRQNRLHPFYMVYVAKDGSIICDHLSPKDLLDKLRCLCKGKTEPIPDLYRAFNRETKDGRDMHKISKLLGNAITSIIQVKEESDINSFLSGAQTELFGEGIKGLDDFELVCFIDVRSDSSADDVGKDFKVVVAGSRDFSDYALLSKTMDRFLAGKRNVTVVSGTARGADRLGERYASERGCKLERIPAQWGVYHKGAGPIRNRKMVAGADAVVVFWNGVSTGAKNIIDCAAEENVPCEVIRI